MESWYYIHSKLSLPSPARCGLPKLCHPRDEFDGAPKFGTAPKYRKFFTALHGGAWATDEIELLWDTDAQSLSQTFLRLKREGLDFFVFIFSGHGGFSRRRDDTILELSTRNGEEENFWESEIPAIAPRELHIFDCCRCCEWEEEEEIKAASARGGYSPQMNAYNRYVARQMYDRLVMRACPFTCKLYACSIGETAEGDSHRGGLFSYHLLNAYHALDSMSGLYVEEAFSYAKQATSDEKPDQTPAGVFPRCLASLRLPWAIPMA